MSHHRTCSQVVFEKAKLQLQILAKLQLQHFDDESWRGSRYAFLAESTFCVSLFCAVTLTC
jgi:hypothetical protein